LGTYRFPGLRGDGILESGQFGDIGRREEVGAGAQHLSQFDEGGAQFFQRHPQPLGRAQGGTSAERTGQGENRGRAQQVQQFTKAMARQNLGNPLEAPQMAHAPNG
jgi:hypothetical protein